MIAGHSTTQHRVVGLGQHLAGDDAAGLLVVEQLRRRFSSAQLTSDRVEIVTAQDASQLLELLCNVEVVWLVDAVAAADRVGDVLTLSLEELDARASCSASSHGLDVAQAIELCRTLYPASIARDIRIVAIAVDPRALSTLLSPRVARGISEAVARLHADLTASLKAGTTSGELLHA
jgi:hydrogenase maturation protease